VVDKKKRYYHSSFGKSSEKFSCENVKAVLKRKIQNSIKQGQLKHSFYFLDDYFKGSLVKVLIYWVKTKFSLHVTVCV
jgi:hypothetical protein